MVGAPVLGPPNPPPVLLGPPGREGPPVRGAPVVGRELIGRGPPGPEGRPAAPGKGRRAPGGGGIGRPVALMGRPGGGGIGRPVALMGGRVDGELPSPLPSPTVRCVGRMVTGPSGDAVRVGAGLGTTTLLRTTLGAGASATTGGAGGLALGALALATSIGASTTLATLVTRVTRAAGSGGAATLGELTGAAALVAAVAFTALAALVALAATSGCTSRRSPSASARRRMRSACASSIEAEGLDAPMPSFWARPSNSLLVRPSSLESSCTRIFFCAKTFP